MFSRQLHQKENVSSVLQISFQWMWVSSSMVVGGAWLFGESILNALYDSHTQEAYLILPLLMLGCMGFSLQYIFGTLLTANGSMKKMINISIIGLVVNVLINLVFIPKWGVLGAAIANIIAQWTMLIAQWYSCHHLLSIEMKTSYRKAVVYSIGLLIFTSAITHFFFIHPNNFKENALAIGLFLVLNLGLAVATRMLDVRGFVNLIRKGD
jgi:O-antigen/teichoic acid export membrane protein